MTEQTEKIEQETCTVQFGEEDAGTVVPRGTTILDAARQAGVFIDSLCGGDGVCGKCRVLVRQGKVKGGTANFLTPEEIRAGYVLACETRIDSDLCIEIPARVGLREEVLEVVKPRRRLRQLALRERQASALDPLVKKIHLKVPAPTLDNNSADQERLIYALRKNIQGETEYQMGLKVTRSLPRLMRESQGDITATVGYRGRLSEITTVAPGNTTKPNLALVVDLGTTTIMAQLVDLAAGQTLDAALCYNSQAAYGADVIRRIIWCDDNRGGLDRMQEACINDINSLSRDLQEKFRLCPADISVVVAAGNTTMMHFLLGLEPRWIRREPYCGVLYQPPAFRAAEVGLTIEPRGLLYCLPSVSAFVGADITAGVMATDMDQKDGLYMLIDVGTNGEIVIGNKDWLVCASASAGPSFEGAGNHDGMRASTGAIDHVRGRDGYDSFSFSTVRDAPPVGFCGTAYVDLLAEMLRMGIIDRTGKFNRSHPSKRLRENGEGTPEFVVVRARENNAERDLVITQDDTANLVRTKAAIYAAAKVLLRSLGLRFSDLDEILVAGAFGNYLDLENAVFIGLLPDLPAEKLHFAGNTSIAGAAMAALHIGSYERARAIAEKMTYFELSTDPTFMEEFTSACFFPHTHIEEFPSVRAKLMG